jgi:hypothetical protein
MKANGERREHSQRSRGATSENLPPKLADLGISKTQSSRWQVLAALSPEEQEAKIAAAKCKAEMAIDGVKLNGRGVAGSRSDEWFTPVPYIKAARAVLGDIDLDSATCAFAQSRIRASSFCTKQHDGLKQRWRGRVWLNPPFSRIADFTAKLDRQRLGERWRGREDGDGRGWPRSFFAPSRLRSPLGGAKRTWMSYAAIDW